MVCGQWLKTFIMGLDANRKDLDDQSEKFDGEYECPVVTIYLSILEIVQPPQPIPNTLSNRHSASYCFLFYLCL